MVAGEEGFQSMDDILKAHGVTDYTIGNTFWTASPLVNDDVSSVFNIIMEVPHPDDPKQTQLVSKQIHVPTSELTAPFINDYSAKNQVKASKDYYDAVKSAVPEYNIDLGNIGGANYSATIFVGGDDNQSPAERRNNSYGMFSVDEQDLNNYKGIINSNDLNRRIPYDEFEKIRVGVENYNNYKIEAGNRFEHLTDRQLNQLYQISNNSNLTANEQLDLAVYKAQVNPQVARAILDITPSGKKRKIANTLGINPFR
jgi:hypothetical protein